MLTDLNPQITERWHRFSHAAHCKHCASGTPADHCGRASAELGAGRVAGALIGVVWFSFLSHRLSPGDTGKFLVVQSLGSLVTIGVDLGIPLTLTKLSCNHEELDRQAVSQAVVRTALAGALAAGLLTILWALSHGSQWWLGAFWAVSVIVNPLAQVYLALLRGRANYIIEAVYEVARNTAILTIGLLAVGVVRGKLFAVVAAYVGAYVLTAAAIPFLTRRHLRFTDEPQPDQRAELALRATFPLAAPGFVGTAYERIDLYLVQVIKGGVVAGLYGVAYKLYDNVLFPAKAIASTAFTAAGKAVVNDAARVARHWALRAMMITAPIAAGLAAAGPTIIRVYNGSRYLVAVPALRILMFTAVPTAGLLVVTPILVLSRRQLVFRWTGIGLAANAVGNFLLVPTLGAKGAAYSYLLTELALFVAFWFALPAGDPVPAPTVVPSARPAIP